MKEEDLRDFCKNILLNSCYVMRLHGELIEGAGLKIFRLKNLGSISSI